MLWILLTAIAGILAIWGKQNHLAVHYVAKPAATLTIIVSVLVQDTVLTPTAYHLVLVALVFSLLGDVVLMQAHKGFRLGLVCFVLAQLAYFCAFSRDASSSPERLLWLLPPVGAAVAYLAWLWPRLRTLRIPVLIYTALLASVAWQLQARYDHVPQLSVSAWLLGAAGGMVFMFADGVLAARRLAHVHPPYALELGSYFTAQLLIAASTWGAAH